MRRAGALVLLAPAVAASAASAGSHAVATVKVERTRLGAILVDGRDRTLYLFTLNTKDLITCVTGYSNCPATWPPYVTTAKPTAEAGV